MQPKGLKTGALHAHQLLLISRRLLTVIVLSMYLNWIKLSIFTERWQGWSGEVIMSRSVSKLHYSCSSWHWILFIFFLNKNKELIKCKRVKNKKKYSKTTHWNNLYKLSYQTKHYEMFALFAITTNFAPFISSMFLSIDIIWWIMYSIHFFFLSIFCFASWKDHRSRSHSLCRTFKI